MAPSTRTASALSQSPGSYGFFPNTAPLTDCISMSQGVSTEAARGPRVPVAFFYILKPQVLTQDGKFSKFIVIVKFGTLVSFDSKAVQLVTLEMKQMLPWPPS